VKYSEERKRSVLAKLSPPHNRTIKEVSEEEGLSPATLYSWRRQARERGQLFPDAGSPAEGWTARDKFAAVLETASMNEAERAEYCRKRGLYVQQLATWREACEAANDWAVERRQQQRTARSRCAAPGPGTGTGADAEERCPCGDRSAPHAVKKSSGDLGGRRGRMISTPDRQTAVTLIKEACGHGARLEPACALLGITGRTYQRWTREDSVRAPLGQDSCRTIPEAV